MCVGTSDTAMPKTIAKDFRTRILSRADYPLWNAFVDRSPEGSVFSKTDYLETLGVAFHVVVAEQRGSIVAGMVVSRNALGVNSNPLFAKYLGVLHPPDLSNNHKTVSRNVALDTALIADIPRHHVWSYTFHPAFRNWLPFFWSNFHQTTRYTYRLSFQASADWRGCYDNKLRSALSRSTAEGLFIEPVHPDELAAAVEASFVDRGNRLPLQRQRLLSILRDLTTQGYLGCFGAREPDGRLLAGAGILSEPRCAYLLLNGMFRAQQSHGANARLVDFALEWASDRCASFDFEGSMYARIERFYRRFGGTLTPYFSIFRSNLMTAAYRTAEHIARRYNA